MAKILVFMNTAEREAKGVFYPSEKALANLSIEADVAYRVLLHDYNLGASFGDIEFNRELFDCGVLYLREGEIWFNPFLQAEEGFDQEIWFLERPGELSFSDVLRNIQEDFAGDEDMIIFVTQLLCALFREEKLHNFAKIYTEWTGLSNERNAYSKMCRKGYIIHSDEGLDGDVIQVVFVL